MIKPLLTVILFFSLAFSALAQQVLLEQFIQPTGGQVNDTLDNGTVVTLDLSTDDAEQENDEVDSYFDDDLDAGWEGAPEDQNLLTLGLRFVNINIPQGAEIDSAFVVFHAHEGKSAEDIAMLTIVGEATDNAATFDEAGFNEDYLLTDRPQTEAQVEWTVAEEWIIWQPYQTSDIAAVIQEIVNRPGWESGNALSVIFLPENQGPSIVENAREFTSFENIADPEDVDPEGNAGDGTNHPERRPFLRVYYQGTVGIAEIQKDFFTLYPNPATHNFVNIQLDSTSDAMVTLTNIAGQEAASFVVKGGKAKINLEGLSQGLYLMQVIQEGTSASKRLVIN